MKTIQKVKFLKFIISQQWLIFLLLFICIEFIIRPFGNFPLNDDWAYSKAVKEYLISGKTIYSNEIAIPFLFQYLIGILFSKWIGFSFLKLRIVSIVFTFFSIYVADLIAKQVQLEDRKRVIFLLIFLCNPLFLTIQNTFLPDVYILFFALISVLMMVLFFKNQSFKNYFWFILFTALGSTSRQSSALIPLVFGVIYLIKIDFKLKSWILASIPFLISLLSLYLFQLYAFNKGFLPANYNLQISALFRNLKNEPIQLIISTFFYLLTSLICLGLFIFPIVFVNFKLIISVLKSSIWNKLGLLFFLLLIGFKVFVTNHYLPFVGNIFYSRGIGPIILTDFNSDTFQESSIWINSIFKMLNFIGGISFYAFAIVFIQKMKNNSKNIFELFTILLMFMYLILISLNYANDRYLIFILPFFILVSIQIFSVKIKLLLIQYGVLSIFSIGIVFSYFRVNESKWKALNYLTIERRISPKKIDGGYEFNSYNNEYDPKFKLKDPNRWWWIIDDQYIVTPFVKRNNYEIDTSFKIQSSILFPSNQIYVLKRVSKEN